MALYFVLLNQITSKAYQAYNVSSNSIFFLIVKIEVTAIYYREVIYPIYI